MNPDGLSYLDLASEALKGGPANLVNGYWSPGYPALISAAMFLFRPSSGQEFPLLHFVNFLIFLLALWAFTFFLSYWPMNTRAIEGVFQNRNKTSYLTPFAFSTFLWFILNFIGVEYVTPDLAVAAVVFLAAGISCRCSLPESSWKHYAALGFVLGVGYYLKAAMFPIALAFLGLQVVLSLLSGGMHRPKLLLSLSVFLLVAAPLLATLSLRAHRLTFGETGRLNYAWYVNGLQKHVGWTGDSPDVYGRPEHPPRKLMEKPLVLEFGSPIKGTFPLWYDPSYWYSGAKVHFDLCQQIAAVRQTLRDYKNDIASPTIVFISGAIVLCVFILQQKSHPTVPRNSWWQLAWPLAVFSMYALVHVESRFLGAFLVLLWLAIYGALIFRADRRVAAAISATVLCSVMVPFTSHLAVVSLRNAGDLFHPKPPSEYQAIAVGLRGLGLQGGDQLAVVGGFTQLYYARYAKVRVIAIIPDAEDFWRLSKWELKSVAERLASVGVRALVVWNRPDTSALAEWKDVNVSDSVRLSVLLVSPEPPKKIR